MGFMGFLEDDVAEGFGPQDTLVRGRHLLCRRLRDGGQPLLLTPTLDLVLLSQNARKCLSGSQLILLETQRAYYYTY